MSPELAVGPEFCPLAKDPVFKLRVGLVAVDECHLVECWGNQFRQKYAELLVLRQWLGVGIPWYVCSATLAPDMLSTSFESGFRGSV